MRANAKKLSKVLAPLTLGALMVGVALVLLMTTMAGADMGQPELLAAPELELVLVADYEVPVACGNAVALTATISNTVAGSVATDVTGTLQLDGLAVLDGPQPPWGIEGHDIAGGNAVDVQWVLTCTQPGTAWITMTTYGTNTVTETEIISLTQYHLTATLEAPPYVCLDADYVVTVTVGNIACTGTATVTPTLATVNACGIGCGDLTPVSAGIDAYDSAVFTTTCCCCNDEDVTFTLQPIDAVSSGDPIDAGLIYYYETTQVVEQWKAHLEWGTLTAIPSTVEELAPFTVNVPVKNTGSGPADDVLPSLDVSPVTSATCGLSSAEDLDPDEEHTFVFDCTCDAEGDVDITVNGVAGTDRCTGDDLAPDYIDPYPASITVHQVVKPTPYPPGVRIIEPTEPYTVGKSFTFQVTAVISNPWGSTLEDVYADLEIVGDAEVVSPDPSIQGLGDIEPGKEEFVSWMVHCTGDVDADITAKATGVFEGTEFEGTDAITVVQVKMHPTLRAFIKEPDGDPTDGGPQRFDETGRPKYYPSETFSVYANIHNDGEEPALNVWAELSFVFEENFVGDGIRTEFDLTYTPIVADSETVRVEERFWGDSVTKDFTLGHPPIVPDSEIVCLDGEPIEPTEYVLNDATGELTFDEAPGMGVEITVDYATTAYNLDDATGVLVFDEAPGVGVDIDVEYECDGASLDFDGDKPGNDYARKKLGDIDGGDFQEVKWTVHCDEPGLVRITVIPSGENDITGDAIENIHDDSVEVRQVPKEEISILELYVEEISGVVSTDGEKIGTSSYFLVTAVIKNTGYADLKDVTATIDYGAAHVDLISDLLIVVGDLDQHEETTISWEFHCPEGADTEAEEEAYRIRFDVDVAGTAEICDQPAEDSAYLEVIQKDLVVDITSPLDGEKYNESETFVVSADIHNRELGETALTHVKARIVLPADVELATGEVAEKDLPNILVGEWETVEWEVHCAAPSVSTIKVEAEGKTTPNTLFRSNYDEVTVIQQEKAHLEAVILEPETCRWFGMSNIYRVVARVTNKMIDVTDPDLKADALAVDVDLDIAGEADIIAGPDPALPFDLEPGAGRLVTWWLHCKGPCHVDIEADPTGTDANTGVAIIEDNTDEDDITVHQMPLEVEIYQYPTEVITKSRTFGISARIKNVCGEDCPEDCDKCVIPDVYATIEVETGLASLVDYENATKYVGDVLTPPQEVEWTLHCDGPGLVKIRVTATTSKDPQTEEDLGYEVSTSALVAFWQVDGPVKYTIPLAKKWNLISLPVIPHSKAIEDVLATIDGMYTEVWSYQDGQWHLHWPGHSHSLPELTTMEDGLGYFVRMYWPDYLLGQGYDYCDLANVGQLPPEYDLGDAGWKLIGFTTCDFSADGEITDADTMDAYDYLMNMDDGARGLWPWEVVGDEARFLRYWEPGASWEALDDWDDMKVFYGYWLKASLDGLSIVPPTW